MAGGDGHFSVRAYTEENIQEIVFKYYKTHKVEISKAIIKPFPFFEGLRDRGLITNKMYTDIQESCRDLVPIHKLAYRALEKLENTLNVEVLEALFSQVNMQEYPELTLVQQDFVEEVRKQLNSQDGDGEELNERSNSRLGIERGCREGSFMRSLMWWSSDSLSSDGSSRQSGLAECHPDTQQTDGQQPNTTHHQNDDSDYQEAVPQSAQESAPAECHGQEADHVEHGDQSVQPPSPLRPCDEEKPEVNLPHHETQMSSCSVLLVDIKKESPWKYSGSEQPARARIPPSHDPQVIEISSDDSKGSSDEAEFVETWPRSKPAISNHSLLSPWERKERQEATCSRHQVAPVLEMEPKASSLLESADSGESAPFRKGPGKRVRGYDDNSSDSSEEELPPIPWITTPVREREHERERGETDSVGTGKTSTWRIHDKKRHAMDVGNTSTLKKDNGKRKVKVRKQTHQVKKAQRGRKETNAKPLRKSRKRGPRIPREKNADFFSPELPVTCGAVRGILYQNKFKQSISVKSIRSEDGRWFTPREFEIEGKFEASKNWRLSVRCHGWPLKELIKKGILPNPPRKRKQQNAWSHNQALIVPYLRKQVRVKCPSKA